MVMNDKSMQVWSNCLTFLKQHISESNFNTWFIPIKPIALQSNKLILEIPNTYFYEWIEEHYIHFLQKALHQEIGKNATLEYIVAPEVKKENKNSILRQTSNTKEFYTPSELISDKVSQKVNTASHLVAKYLFANFIEGKCNQLSRAAGLAIAQRPGVSSFNPFILYGGVGLGKTHLAQAIGNEIKICLPHKFVLYVSTEEFTNQFISSIKHNQVQSFVNYYLQVDTLIIDDIQFLSKKEKTQESFFHIFNRLHQANKQIIITCDQPPSELEGMQERLLSRFKWGLSTDLYTPDYATRVAIVYAKAHEQGTQLPPFIAEYMAKYADTNIRELEGVVTTVIASARLYKRKLDISIVKKVLKSLIKKKAQTSIDMPTIIKTVTDYYDISTDTLCSKSRKQNVVKARSIIMYLAKDYTKLSHRSIAEKLKRRDHSSVTYAIKRVKKELKSPQFEQTLTFLKSQLFDY